MAEMIRTVLVDDESPARSLMREYLGAHADIVIEAECANGFEAVKVIGELQPDLVFLDVQMPKLDGFEVLELIDPGPAIVFCTAYDEYALKAFEVHAVDYLLKPFGRDRLAEALDHVRKRRAEMLGAVPGGAATAAANAKLGAAARPPGRWLERVLVRDGAKVHVIPIDSLDYLPISSIPIGSCGSTARTCCRSRAWRDSSCTPRTAGWRSSRTANSFR